MSSFLFYANANRQELLDANPGLSFRDSQRELAALWKELSDEERESYELQAKMDRDRYKAEMETYVKPEEYAGGAVKKHKKKKQVQDPTKPKRVPSSFLLYCQDARERLREEHPEAKMAQIQQYASHEWAMMDNEAKKPYEDQHQQLRGEWVKAMALHEDSVVETEVNTMENPMFKKEQVAMYGAHVQLSEQLKNAAAEGVDLPMLIARQQQHVLKCQSVAKLILPAGTPNLEETKEQQRFYAQQQEFLLCLQQFLLEQMPTTAYAAGSPLN